MLIPNSVGKEFENPESGEYIGVVADVIELGLVTTQWGAKVKIRIIWLLNANDSDGKPFRVMSEVNAKMADKPKKSRLYEIAEQVFNKAPEIGFDSDMLLGRSNRLFVVQEPSAKDPKKKYANVKGILPLRENDVPFAIPAGFVRFKDKDAKPATAATSAPATASAPVAPAASDPAFAAAVAAAVAAAQAAAKAPAAAQDVKF